MQAYLINLERAQDRHDYILSELSRLLPDIKVERALCIDIKVSGWKPPSFVKPGRWKSDRWSLTPSDIEIFRSHLDCWEKIAASGRPGLVLEDDLLFADDFGRVAGHLEQSGIHGIVRLDAVQSPLILGKPAPSVDGYSLTPALSLTASAAAYLLDPQSAASLARDARIERTVDDFLFDPTPKDRGARGHGLPILQLEPAIAIQAQFGSFSSADREIPEFLKMTKRTDVKTRKDRSYTGPLLYRLRKEVLRFAYRFRRAGRIKKIEKKGGRWGMPMLHPDLQWN
ncbi:glycosyltransferase family 25 protein [Ruegeria sp. HKCCD8929]|uniref:glycosyltransferase family 25 protein n=1 Tax=Ruegeria sp. HKCCD8929 TaxID=2683006 RepID=UPI00148947C8|nr:glycosyltransferase family 25 protein [Ruegeria sp. HKCCD8929]